MKISLTVCTLLLSASAFSQAAPPAQDSTAGNRPINKISAGSVLPVELSKTVDAKKAHSGDPVLARIPHDLSANGKVVIPQDTKVMGHVAEVRPPSKETKD